MKIIVTGGAGFVGSNLSLALDKEHNVIVVDDFSNSDFLNLTGFKGEVYAHDIVTIDWDSAFGKEKIDVIFHEAAITDTTVTDQKKMIEVNVNAFKNLLDFAVANNIRVIYASSAAVYGNGKSPMKENQDLHPLNVYGFSKRIMDNVAYDYIKKYPQLKLVGLRYFNVFGPREKHKNKFASMIWQLSRQMKEGKKPRVFKGGEQTRDHVYVKDVVQANIRMLSYEGSGVFNVGTGKETSFNEIIEYLNLALRTNLMPEYIENPYTFFQNKTCADITKIRNAVGYIPEFSVKDGILDYFKEING